jgi:hypothetical protein
VYLSTQRTTLKKPLSEAHSLCAPLHHNERQLRINAFAVIVAEAVNGGVEFRVNIGHTLLTGSTDSGEVTPLWNKPVQTPANHQL